MSENQKIIYDLLKEVRKKQDEAAKELVQQSTCLGNLELDTKDMKKDIADLKDDMAHHIARTDGVEHMVTILKDLHEDNKDKIEVLEKALKNETSIITELKNEHLVNNRVKSYFKKNIIWILSVISALIGIGTKIIGLW